MDRHRAADKLRDLRSAQEALLTQYRTRSGISAADRRAILRQVYERIEALDVAINLIDGNGHTLHVVN